VVDRLVSTMCLPSNLMRLVQLMLVSGGLVVTQHVDR